MKPLLRSFFLIVTLLFSVNAIAQNKGSVTGKVIYASDKTPVDFATVSIKSLKDSSIVASGQTSESGTFSLKSIPLGQFRITIGYVGLKTTSKTFEITNGSTSVNIGQIAMDDDGLNLNTVTIQADAPAVVVKKDTLEFDAKQIKVRENAVVEDVLKKLPGVEVAKDGSITAQGETITKVKVDGKEFFGNDPLLATRNLPADMLDKIQVIDELSEQGRFTGIDDGTRSKILNITTKSGMKKGYFGNSTLGYGTDDRYEGNINVNHFNNEEQISVVGQFNNVNKQGFGQGGGMGSGFGGGGMGGGMGGGGNRGGSASGITNTNAAGINFGNNYSDGTQFQGSYFFNDASTRNEQRTYTQNLLGAQTTEVFNNSKSLTDRLNHRLNLMVDTRLSKTATIKVQPNFSYSENGGNTTNEYDRELKNGKTVGKQNNRTNSSTPSFSNNLLIRNQFARRGRTLSLNINTSINDSKSGNFNYIRDVKTVNGIDTVLLTDQFNNLNNNSINNTTRVVFTEPLSKTTSLEFNYQNGFVKDNQAREVYSYNPISGQYDVIDVMYTNTFENRTLTNAAGFSYSLNERKYNLNVGLAAQHTNRVNNNLTTGVSRTQNFVNLTPTANFRYNFSNSKRLNIRYRGQTQQPSINQIQPIPDNTNTQTLFSGNADLRPAFNNNINFNYNNFNFTKGRMFFAFLNLSQTMNAIGNKSYTITDTLSKDYGKISTTYINVDGVYSANGSVNMGIPLLPERKLNLNVSLNANYNRNVNFTTPTGEEADLVRNITNTYSLTNRYSFVTNFDKFDLIGGISGTYNRSTYSANADRNTNFYTLNPSFDISYLFPGNIRLAIDLDYIKNTGGGEDYNRDFTLVNSYISRQFFKNRGTFKLSVNDAFNQNRGISRTVSNNAISESNYTVLKRYYMLSFTYSLTRIGGRTIGNNTEGGNPGGGPGGGMRMRM